MSCVCVWGEMGGDGDGCVFFVNDDKVTGWDGDQRQFGLMRDFLALAIS